MNEAQGVSNNQPYKKADAEQGLKVLWVALVMFVIGVAGGILLFIAYPLSGNKNKQEIPIVSPKPISMDIPVDAEKIQECADNKGELYARVKDLHKGPIYMVQQNKVIGIEYKFDPEQTTGSQIYKYMSLFNRQIDHFNFGTESSSESAELNNGQYIDFYLVDSKTEQAIICEKNPAATNDATGAADLTTTPGPDSSIAQPSLTPKE